MTYERRLKGTQRWRQITEAEARSLLTLPAEFAALERGEAVMTPSGVVRRCPEPPPNPPGISEEPPGAYARG